MAIGIASFDHEVTALNKADIAKPLPYTIQCLSIRTFRSDPEIANAYPIIRLGKRVAKRSDLRPCCSADEGDERTSLHSITSSASSCIEFGTARPNALAVLRLITSSNLVACTTGRSEGFSPLRMRPT